MTSESSPREKLTRIWSQRRGCYVVVRVRYEEVAHRDSSFYRLLSSEIVNDGY
jgi:hypothetical protein